MRRWRGRSSRLSRSCSAPWWLTAALMAASLQASEVNLGGIVLTVSDSWTAELFHIVDQLSEWDEACHKQYGRWAAKALTIDDEDRRLLRQHAELRRKRGWNNGFEQAFYVADSVETAARNAVQGGHLSPEEALAEQRILLHFAPKLMPLRQRSAAQITEFRQRLSREARNISKTVRALARFSETRTTVRLPLYLIPNPEQGNAGGGFNGGRLVLEVQAKPDALPFLFHECLHALLWPHKERIEQSAKSAGLSFGAWNEGIAYAFAPGLVDPAEESDSLGEALVRTMFRGTTPADSYVQAYSVAVVLRPLLRAAMGRGETITAFLPRAVEKWRARAR